MQSDRTTLQCERSLTARGSVAAEQSPNGGAGGVAGGDEPRERAVESLPLPQGRFVKFGRLGDLEGSDGARRALQCVGELCAGAVIHRFCEPADDVRRLPSKQRQKFALESAVAESLFRQMDEIDGAFRNGDALGNFSFSKRAAQWDAWCMFILPGRRSAAGAPSTRRRGTRRRPPERRAILSTRRRSCGAAVKAPLTTFWINRPARVSNVDQRL